MDQITISRIALLHPKLRDEATEIYKEIYQRLNGRVILRFSHTIRTWPEQDGLYAQGRTKPGPIVTYAKGGDSYHNYALASDCVLLIDKDGNGTYETASWDFFKDEDKDGIKDFEEIDFVFKSYGWEGLYKADGKRWDFPHFQKTFGYNISQLKKKYLANDFILGTNYVNI
ncbi:MAG: M15 family metallopeptidase [Bacteroidota bacterium]